MRPILRMTLALTMVSVWPAGISDAQEGLTKRDRQGPVTVTVTLTAPPAIGAPVKAKVALDTHSVALDGIALQEAVILRTADGNDLSPTAVEQAKGSGHHRQAVLVFPPPAAAGPLQIVVKNVGGVAERSFSWELPLKP